MYVCTYSFSQFNFHPSALETQGPLNESARNLLSDVGRRMPGLLATVMVWPQFVTKILP